MEPVENIYITWIIYCERLSGVRVDLSVQACEKEESALWEESDVILL